MTIAELLRLRSPKAAGGFPFTIAACIGLIVLGTSPILFKLPAGPTVAFFNEYPFWRQFGRVFLVALVALAILAISRREAETGAAKIFRYCGFVLIAALLTDVHFYTRDVEYMGWQIGQYEGILQHTYPPPDQYRFLPQGILWWMILGNGDFVVPYLAYRFFFTFLLCQAIYTLGRSYLAPRDAVIVVLLYAAFYPLSTRYYYGNMADPLSHSVMLGALIYCHRGQFWPVFWLCVLGMFVKETMLLVAPCYFLMNLEAARVRHDREWLRVALLILVGLAVFLVCRIPFHFNFDFQTLNRTNGLMIYSNLGLAHSQARSTVSVFQRYLHPLLFIFMWLPLIVWQRKRLPPSLFWTSLYLATALYVINLCFGWNYESRNFVPALIVLLICTLMIVNSLLARPQNDAVATRG